MANRLLRRAGVIRKLAIECAQAGSKSAWGRKHGFTSQYISSVIHGGKKPSARLLAAIGLEMVERYAPISKRRGR